MFHIFAWKVTETMNILSDICRLTFFLSPDLTEDLQERGRRSISSYSGGADVWRESGQMQQQQAFSAAFFLSRLKGVVFTSSSAAQGSSSPLQEGGNVRFHSQSLPAQLKSAECKCIQAAFRTVWNARSSQMLTSCKCVYEYNLSPYLVCLCQLELSKLQESPSWLACSRENRTFVPECDRKRRPVENPAWSGFHSASASYSGDNLSVWHRWWAVQ